DRLIPRKKGGVLFFYAGAIALAGAAVITFGRGGSKQQPLPTAPAALHPSAVRINFNSDPDGAIVVRSDGKTLGLTPLSIEGPYSASAVEFKSRKVGFDKKTVYVAPTLPSPLSAPLHKTEAPPPPAPPPTPTTPAVRRTSTPTPPAQQTAKKKPPTDKP